MYYRSEELNDKLFIHYKACRLCFVVVCRSTLQAVARVGKSSRISRDGLSASFFRQRFGEASGCSVAGLACEPYTLSATHLTASVGCHFAETFAAFSYRT